MDVEMLEGTFPLVVGQETQSWFGRRIRQWNVTYKHIV